MPAPTVLRRESGAYREHPLEQLTFLLGAAPGGYATSAARTALVAAGAGVLEDPTGARAGADRQIDGAVFDASGILRAEGYRHLYEFFHPLVRCLARNARVLLIGAPPAHGHDPLACAAARGLEGFMRSLARETGRRGINVNLIQLERGAEARLDEPLRFFCGARCTYVDGQVVHVGRQACPPQRVPHVAALRGKVALVTGAARGIGAATAARLAEEGARLICLDVAADRDGLYEIATRVGGMPLVADISDLATPDHVAEFLLRKCAGLDVLVHNAGITRDRTLANMSEDFWDRVIAVNFAAIAALDEVLLGRGVLRSEGRIICLSSMAGIAGNFGQTNYAASKAALIGYVTALAGRVAAQGITVNAVAPGFIETRMTERMPLVRRELGRRISSLAQGGQPRDVAELITFLATPGACGVTGNTLRVCGQNLLGA